MHRKIIVPLITIKNFSKLMLGEVTIDIHKFFES